MGGGVASLPLRGSSQRLSGLLISLCGRLLPALVLEQVVAMKCMLISALASAMQSVLCSTGDCG
jgi:hypothetical protein